MQESGEDYLETILLLKMRQGYVRAIDIANEMEYSKASISRAVKIWCAEETYHGHGNHKGYRALCAQGGAAWGSHRGNCPWLRAFTA